MTNNTTDGANLNLTKLSTYFRLFKINVVSVDLLNE
jgi:hypothetical protein